MFLSFLMLLSPIVGLSQSDSCNYSVRGTVLDVKTKKPIPYVNVVVRGANRGTVTDINGAYVIEGLCSKVNTVDVSGFGYSDSSSTSNTSQGETQNIYLEQKALKLKTVNVTGKLEKKKGTETISQIQMGQAELSIDPTRTLASAISEQQGVSFTSMGSNVQLPVIHGLYGNRVLVLNNGMKHGFQNWGTDHAPEVDIASASRITILKGAAGVRFGPEALGGAVIVESDPLNLRNPFNAQVGAGYQTNGRGYNSSLKLGQGFKKWSYFVNGSFTKIGDRETPDYVLTNSGKEENTFGAGLRFYSGNWDAKVYYSYVNQNLALLRSSIAHSGTALTQAINSEEPVIIRPFSYDIAEPNQLVQHHFAKAEVSWKNDKVGKLTMRAGRQINGRQEFDVRRNSELPIIDLELSTTDYQLDWKHKPWMGLDGLIGVQYFYQDNNNNPGTGTTPFIPNYNTDRYSAFLIESKTFGKNIIEAGVRMDFEINSVRGREVNQSIFRDEYDFANITTTVGYVRELSEKSSFRTNIGTAWRTPNMAELFSFGQHGFKTQFGLLRYYFNEEGEVRTDRVVPIAESEIEPEVGYKFINELEHKSGRNRHTLTAYSHYIENFIFNRPYAVISTIRGPMPVFIYDQADALFIGFDYSWNRSWTESISGTLGISYLWSTNMSKNEPLINQPPISADYRLTWNQGEFWWFTASKFTVKPRYTFQQFNAPREVPPEDLIDGTEIITNDSEIFDFKAAPDGYFLLDLTWQFELNRLSGSLSVNNLLNARYRDYLNEMRYFANEPGRNIMLNLRYRIGANQKGS